ncbi:MAG: ribose-phosphate pyrophosphokinase-like domain-containing protein [Patescibacteria group bacterium]|nr:ribose-phosphate pyrophosphokinase-like domain-containing protein [Patescibacteria group bacterium]MDD5715178.1 ribose-phosphate pyrophosphokinase-like domain-containing protein [Patescibacteria group bacterium]
MQLTIIPTSTTHHLAKKLVNAPHITVMVPDTNKDGTYYFPDGERYTRLSKVSEIKDRAVILHAGQPHPNKGLAELEMLVSILHNAEIDNIEIFFTYFPYGMQDKVFEHGETNVAENFLKKLTSYYKVRQIYAIDAHFHGRLWATNYPFHNITALPLLKQAALKLYPDMVFSTPDAGSHRRTGISGTKKKRIHSYHTEIHSDEQFGQMVQGKMVGVIDDLLETGGTLDRFYDTAIKCGARDVVALITHGVLESGIDRITHKYKHLFLANTIEQERANVDVSPLIIKTLGSQQTLL